MNSLNHLEADLEQLAEEARYNATGSCVADSPFAGQIADELTGSPVMTTTKSFDRLNRLQSISTAGTVGIAEQLAMGYETRVSQAVTAVESSREPAVRQMKRKLAEYSL